MSDNAGGAAANNSAANEGKPAGANPAVGEAKPNEPSLPIAEKQSEGSKPEDNKDSGTAPVIYEPTNDPALDMALEFVGNLGFGPEDPAMVAAGDGDFSMLEAKLAAMGDKARGWEKFIALGKSAYENVKTKAQADAAKRAADIHNVVGGEEQWKAIKEWAGRNAEPEEQKVVNAALNAGGMQAKAMAFYLSTLYERAAGVNQTGKPAVNQNASNGGAAQAGALSPRKYTQEVAALQKRLGSKFDSSPEYRQLQQRRQAWRG